jgi:hypothetical protein
VGSGKRLSTWFDLWMKKGTSLSEPSVVSTQFSRNSLPAADSCAKRRPISPQRTGFASTATTTSAFLR